MTEQSLLSVRDLKVYFQEASSRFNQAQKTIVHAVDGVSFDLRAKETLAIVGETGSGKTTIARALLGLHPPGATTGSIRYQGQELNALSESDWRPIRWNRIALSAQTTGTAFDPLYRIEEQIIEPLREHQGLSASQAQQKVQSLGEQVGLSPRHLHAYPHQLSGGEKQRAMLAMALSCDPQILIVDEPTSGQDMLSRHRMIDYLQEVRQTLSISLLIITHDLASVSQLADRIAVLYAGKLIETGPAQPILENPRHPYTRGLLNAYPNMTTQRDLRGIRGELPDPANPPTGCRFHPRCTQAIEKCAIEEPPLVQTGDRFIACHLGGVQVLLKASNLRKTFSLNGNGNPKNDTENASTESYESVKAVQDVSLELYEGEVVALIGETGSGKTTLGSLLVSLREPDTGQIIFEGKDLRDLDRQEHKRMQSRIQFIAQDPFDAISPRLTVQEIVREPLDIQNLIDKEEKNQKVNQAIEAVGLPISDSFIGLHSHQLSGGQLQRVAIARALALSPKLIIADEPVSMLDASEQAKVINLLKDIQNEYGLGLLLISHDIALVRKVSDRILVMQAGKIIESGPTNRVINYPQKDYTRALLNAAPAFIWGRNGQE